MARKVSIPRAAIKKIYEAVDAVFDRAIARFLNKPLPGDKRLEFKLSTTLPSLFAAAANEERTEPDKSTLATLLEIAEGFVNSQRHATKAHVVKSVESWLNSANQEGVDTDLETVLGGELGGVFQKATDGMQKIVATESNTAKNVGGLTGITLVNAASGIEDPVVYFVVVRDDSCCDECKRLHLLDDELTPRLWYLSEVGHGYHKKGDSNPKMSGLHPHCFTSDTRIHTDRGLLTIKELFEQGGGLQVVVDRRVRNRRVGNNQFGAEIPQSTWFYRHASGASLKSASHVYYTGDQECLRISLDCGIALEVSLGHEVWVDDGIGGKKVRADQVRVGDKVPLLSGEGAFGADHFPEVAELMGNLLGDGCLSSTAEWNFFGDDIPYGRYLKEMARKLAPGLSEELVVHQPNEKYNVPHAGFNSVVLGRLFTDSFGLSKKPRRVPSRIWSADKETVSAFLRGLYAADGHSERTPSVVIAQNDLAFLQEIQLLLSNFGLRSRIFSHGESCEKSIVYANGDVFETKRKACWRLHIGGWDQVSVFAGQIGFGVPKKQQELSDRLKTTAKKTKHGGWRTSRIVSITPIGVKPTYCLTEPLTNTVTANGVVTGNCRCTLATLLPGFGFEGGSPTFVSTGHKEIEVQRDFGKKEPVWGPEALRKSTPRGEKHFHDNRERYDTNGKYLDKGPHLDSWLEHVNKHTGKSGEEAYQHLLTAPISVSFSTNRIGKIDNDGRLKNVFETDESMGAGTHNVSQLDPYYLKVRRDTEHSLFGIPHDASGEERPVYGSVMASWNTGNRPMNYGYGNAHLVLKQHVKNRTTFTPDDSLGLSDYWKGDVGESVCSASHLPTLLSHVPVPATREAKFMPGISGDPYVEAQIHGGVDLNHDVESIHVNDFARSPVDEHTAKKVVNLGRKYKLPVYKHRNDGTSETLYHPDWGAGATEANPLHAPEPSPAVKKAEVVVQTLDDFKLFKSERPKGVFLNFKSQEANLVPIVVKSVEEVCKDGHVFTDDSQAFKIFVKNKEQAERVVGLIQNKILGE